jgi:DNA-binding winged helix-turn-helix (wHTH) protein
MQEFPSSARSVRFGVFEVDLRSGELRKKGTRIRLQSQPFVLLTALLKQRGEVVTREELRRTLWPQDTFVDFDHSLGTAINKLREVLGDSAANPRFIETLPRRGYRFIAPVEAVGESENTPVVSQAPPDKQEPAAGDLLETRDHDQVDTFKAGPVGVRRRWPLPWKISGFAVLLLSAGFIVLTLPQIRQAAPIRSLAVLPLENLSGDPSQDYFSDGMTDELITELVRADQRIASNLPYLGDDLQRGPQALTGDRAGVERRRRGGRHRFAFGEPGSNHSALDPGFRRQALMGPELRGRVERYLAPPKGRGSLHCRADSDQIESERTDRVEPPEGREPEAYEANLKGRYFWNKRTGEGLKKAIGYFNQAIEKDPNYARAYTGLADSYALMGDCEYGVLPPAEAFPKEGGGDQSPSAR